MLLDDLHRIPAPVLPDVPEQVLLDAARAYVDANAALNRIGTNDTLQEAAARAVVTSQLLQAAVATAYAAGLRAQPQGSKFQWGSRRDGYRTVRVTSEDRARFDARTAAGGGVEILRRRLGPWELVEYVPPRVREVGRG